MQVFCANKWKPVKLYFQKAIGFTFFKYLSKDTNLQFAKKICDKDKAAVGMAMKAIH